MQTLNMISTWAMSTGIKQLSLDHKRGIVFSDHMRHLFHHITALRKCDVGMHGLIARHLVACDKILGKLAFEASLMSIEIDFNELNEVQNQIRKELDILLQDDDTHYDSDSLIDNIRSLHGIPQHLAKEGS